MRQFPQSSSYSYSSFVLDKNLIHEDEDENADEKYQNRSPAYALKPETPDSDQILVHGTAGDP
jgi:hypothetical protein